MIRLQIQLDEDQARELRRTAEEDGISQAEVTRRAVSAYLSGRHRPGEATVKRALAMIGRESSSCPDLAEEHDRYLADGIAERLSSRAVQR